MLDPDLSTLMFLQGLVFTTVFGACVGSFLNVVIYRLPERKSLVSPPSHCPCCDHRLAWYDNVPVLGWFLLAGKCRYCRSPISIQYPIIEALCAALFGGLFWAYYYSGLRPDFASPGLGNTWPTLVVHLCLVGALLGATMIDARLYLIPLEIPWTATVIAVVVLPLGAWRLPEVADIGQPAVASMGGAAIGGAIGLAIALGLLRVGALARSFDEEDAICPQVDGDDPAAQPSQGEAVGPSDSGGEPGDTGEAGRGGEAVDPSLWPEWEHPRREVLKEAMFLMLPLLGAITGLLLVTRGDGSVLDPINSPPLRALGTVVAGYLVGGGIVWMTRILGTLMFGREAMGLGDVHLLAAVGAVIGPVDVIYVFFIAPFFGLGATLVMLGVAQVIRQRTRPIPYGPYLAAAALLVMVLRDWLVQLAGVHPLFAIFGML